MRAKRMEGFTRTFSRPPYKLTPLLRLTCCMCGIGQLLRYTTLIPHLRFSGTCYKAKRFVTTVTNFCCRFVTNYFTMFCQPLFSMDTNEPVSLGFGSFESKPGRRVFLHGLPEPGYINFGKTFEGHQSFFLEDGRLYAPRQLADLGFEAIVEACAFDMRTRHPNTFELLDTE